jgi:hypothetical protein
LSSFVRWTNLKEAPDERINSPFSRVQIQGVMRLVLHSAQKPRLNLLHGLPVIFGGGSQMPVKVISHLDG